MLINRNFGLLWIGHTISLLGDTIVNTTLVVWLAVVLAQGQPWAPLAVSGVLVAAAVPAFLGPLAGVLVDRWDRRRTMLWMDALRIVLVGLLVLATNDMVPLPIVPGGRLSVAQQLAAVYAVVFLTGICARFFDPARFALLGDVVPGPLQPRATGLSQVANYLTFIIGPAVAPALLFVAGISWALIIDALSFGVSFIAILALRAPRVAPGKGMGATEPPVPPAAARARFGREFAAGLRFVMGNRSVSALLVTLTIGTLGGGALSVLNIFFVTQNLHASAESYGLFASSIGVGAVLGSVVASVVVPRVGLVRSFTFGFLLASVSVMVYSRLTDFAPALGVGVFYGVCEAAVNVAFGPLLLRVTPRELLGRAVSIVDTTTSTAGLIGTALAGYLASDVLAGFHQSVLGMTFGPIDTIFGGAALFLGCVILLQIPRLGLKDPPPHSVGMCTSA